MGASVKKDAGRGGKAVRKNQLWQSRPNLNRKTPTPTPALQSKKRGQPQGVEATQTEFLDALKEGVQQANDGELMSTDKLLEELRIKHASKKDPGH